MSPAYSRRIAAAARRGGRGSGCCPVASAWSAASPSRPPSPSPSPTASPRRRHPSPHPRRPRPPRPATRSSCPPPASSCTHRRCSPRCRSGAAQRPGRHDDLDPERRRARDPHLRHPDDPLHVGRAERDRARDERVRSSTRRSPRHCSMPSRPPGSPASRSRPARSAASSETVVDQDDDIVPLGETHVAAGKRLGLDRDDQLRARRIHRRHRRDALGLNPARIPLDWQPRISSPTSPQLAEASARGRRRRHPVPRS